MTSKEEIGQVESAIRRVLMAKWDPIGINDEPQAADEYDGYIWGIYGLLKRDAGNEEIAEHLLKIETERMGLTDREGKPFASLHALLSVAAELREILPSISRKS